MKYVLYIFSALTFLAALSTLGVAKSAIHEIAAYVMLLVSAVLFSGAAIVGAIGKQSEQRLMPNCQQVKK